MQMQIRASTSKHAKAMQATLGLTTDMDDSTSFGLDTTSLHEMYPISPAAFLATHLPLCSHATNQNRGTFGSKEVYLGQFVMETTVKTSPWSMGRSCCDLRLTIFVAVTVPSVRPSDAGAAGASIVCQGRKTARIEFMLES